MGCRPKSTPLSDLHLDHNLKIYSTSLRDMHYRKLARAKKVLAHIWSMLYVWISRKKWPKCCLLSQKPFKWDILPPNILYIWQIIYLSSPRQFEDQLSPVANDKLTPNENALAFIHMPLSLISFYTVLNTKIAMKLFNRRVNHRRTVMASHVCILTYRLLNLLSWHFRLTLYGLMKTDHAIDCLSY